VEQLAVVNGRIEMSEAATVQLLERSSPQQRHDLLRAGIPYALYLKTEAWETLREEVLARANRTCAACGKGAWVQAHHRTYARIGMEAVGDLVALCLKCHTSLHVGEKVLDQLPMDLHDLYCKQPSPDAILDALYLLWRDDAPLPPLLEAPSQ
jgi:ribosomal protein S27AE